MHEKRLFDIPDGHLIRDEIVKSVASRGLTLQDSIVVLDSARRKVENNAVVQLPSSLSDTSEDD